ncbi:MAG: AAA family ATPase [Thermodesulfobacteriota bacterium]
MTPDLENIRKALQCGQPGCACGRPGGLVHCPGHEDSKPSLSVTEKNGKLLVYDHGGCDSAQVIKAFKALNLWPSSNGNGRPKFNIIKTYDYQDPTGKMVYQVCRMDPKDFRQRRPDGKGGWIWNIAGVDRVPYRLPELLKAETVYIVEGEKDVDRLRTLGFTATCNPGGAGKWRTEFRRFFQGKRVVVFPDNDDPGRGHAQNVARNLYGLAVVVRVVELPGLPEKGDVSDWLKAGGTADQLKELADAAPEWKPQEAQEAPDQDYDRLEREAIQNEAPKRLMTARELLSRTYSKVLEIIDKGILPAGGGMLIAGESGEGKSLIRTELAIHLIMGWPLWGLEIPTARKILIIQFENTESTEQYRLKKMLYGLGITDFPADNLLFSDRTLRYDLGKTEDWTAALDLVKESNAEVIIWDPLTSLHSVNENDNVQMRKILDSITEINRKANVTSIVLHHFGKPVEGMNNSHRTRGASSIRDWADTLITLNKKPHEHKILRKLDFVKVRNGPELKPILLERDECFLHHITEEDVMCSPEQVKAILTALGGQVDGQGKLLEAIIEAVNCTERSAVSYIKIAVDRGFIRAEINPRNKRMKRYVVS